MINEEDTFWKIRLKNTKNFKRNFFYFLFYIDYYDFDTAGS